MTKKRINEEVEEEYFRACIEYFEEEYIKYNDEEYIEDDTNINSPSFSMEFSLLQVEGQMIIQI
jgi:hypothetical protein